MKNAEYRTHKILTLMSMLTFVFSADVFAQSAPFAQAPLERGSTNQTENKVMLVSFPYKGDTLPLVTLRDVNVFSKRTFKSEKEQQAYLKLKRDVRKAYPFAILASIKLKEYDAILNNMPESERAPYLKKTEKELKTQFESDLRNLTMSQGRILIRLINRETGMTTYKVIKDYRGGFSAFMWQSLGLLWGNNLKWTYDPTQGEDKLIEGIIGQIEDGEV